MTTPTPHPNPLPVEGRGDSTWAILCGLVTRRLPWLHGVHENHRGRPQRGEFSFVRGVTFLSHQRGEHLAHASANLSIGDEPSPHAPLPAPRSVRPPAAVWLAFLLALAIPVAAAPPAPGLERFYVGSYAGKISVSSLDLGTGTFGTITQAVTTTDPSFVAMPPSRAFLYSVNEGANAVSAFAVNATNGTLKLLNQKPSGGGAPAFIVVDGSGRNVLVANYDGGSVSVFPLQADGTLGDASAHVQHPGLAPHAHCVTLDSSNHFAFVCDKGLDQIRSYIFDAAAGSLTTNTTLITAVAAGSGPRHLVFEPQYRRAYVICETVSTVIGFDYDPVNGVLTPFQTISTLPPAGFAGNITAEIAVHPSGRFLYGSNRGYNTVVVYSIDPASGVLTPVQQQKTGATPRNFAIDPTGAFCLVAGQTSNDIRLYSINPETGQLSDTGKKLSSSAPVCILPFLLQPPEPVVTLSPAANNTLQLSIGNSLNLLTYQLYRTPTLSAGMTWDLLATGERGQTVFVLTNTLEQEYFRVGVSTNY